jgi:hypothetical protein
MEVSTAVRRTLANRRRDVGNNGILLDLSTIAAKRQDSEGLKVQFLTAFSALSECRKGQKCAKSWHSRQNVGKPPFSSPQDTLEPGFRGGDTRLWYYRRMAGTGSLWRSYDGGK